MNEFYKKFTLAFELDDKDFKTKLKKGFTDGFSATLSGIGASFLKGLKNVFDSALTELSSMTRYSMMTNSHVRDLKLGYGLSSSQAYGFDKALNVMGFDSMEDLMWANSQQLELFRNAFQKYSDYYEKTMTPEYVAQQLEYQVEMEMFKQDLQNSVISFLMDNKETIMTMMRLSIDVSKFIIDALGWTVDFLTDEGRTNEERLRETQNILSSSSSTNTDIRQSNTFNNVSQSDRQWIEASQEAVLRQLYEKYSNG